MFVYKSPFIVPIDHYMSSIHSQHKIILSTCWSVLLGMLQNELTAAVSELRKLKVLTI